MNPADDPTWLACTTHALQHWCDNTRDSMLAGTDADLMTIGMRYCVPIVPSMDFYAEVSIGNEWITPICASMDLVFGTDPFSMNEELIPLGLWTKGEGRLVMASAINSWCEAKDNEVCQASTHSIEQESELYRRTRANEEIWLKANNWCVAYHLMCLPCYGKQTARFNASAASIPRGGSGAGWTATTNPVTTPQVIGGDLNNLTASDFGIGGITAPRSSGNFNNSARQEAAKQRLREKFGNGN